MLSKLSKIIFAAVLFSAGIALAWGDTLNSLEIVKTSDGCKLVLDGNIKSPVNRKSHTENELTVELKKTLPAPNFKAVYKDVPDIADVSVIPDGKSTIVNVNGMNARNFDIVFPDGTNVPIDTTNTDIAVFAVILSAVAATGLVSVNGKHKEEKVNVRIQSEFNRQIRQQNTEKEQRKIRNLKTIREHYIAEKDKNVVNM